MANKYQAVLFSADGDRVTDFRDSESIQAVWDRINDMGSRWYFYPLPFVATDKTIMDAPRGLEFLKGKRIKTVRQYLTSNYRTASESERADIHLALAGEIPLSFAFPQI